MEQSRGELIRVIKGAVLHAFPILRRRLLPVRGRIVAVYTGAGRGGTNGVYTVDVQPLDAAGRPKGPVLPHLAIPTIWVGDGVGVLAIPPVGALARVGWYETGEPYLDAVLPDGYSLPAQSQGRLRIVHPSGIIEVSSSGIWLANPEGIRLETSRVTITGDLVVGGLINP